MGVIVNNEEKILEILGRIEGDVSELKSDVSELKSDVSELKKRTAKIEITQENVVLPRIQLLAEGHTIIQKQIKDISVIDRMQDDIVTLKNAVRFLTQKVEEMEKAM